MNARPYIFGCLCLVGATGTAAASDIDPAATGLLSPSGAGATASFEGSARSSSQGNRESVGGDVMSAARHVSDGIVSGTQTDGLYGRSRRRRI